MSIGAPKTICGKHDEISKLADQIISMVEKAKDDGMRMETGLNEKRREINRLEKEVEELKEELKTANETIEKLNSQID